EEVANAHRDPHPVRRVSKQPRQQLVERGVGGWAFVLVAEVDGLEISFRRACAVHTLEYGASRTKFLGGIPNTCRAHIVGWRGMLFLQRDLQRFCVLSARVWSSEITKGRVMMRWQLWIPCAVLLSACNRPSEYE